MFPKLTIEDAKIRGKIVLVRTDYNVPIEDGQITSDLRLRASIPTLSYLRKHGAKKIILISHLGRPDGRRMRGLSLKPVAVRLSELLDALVDFVDDVSGPDVEETVDGLKKGGILLLENLRFFKGEEQNSREFADEIIESTHAQLFVQDGFAVIHRAHASTSAITEDLPAVAGLLVEEEVSALLKAAHHPDHPVTVIIGGAKVADKQPLIDHFLPLADHIVVGGKIAADGYHPENDISDKDAHKIYVATDFSDDEKLDIGPDSTAHILKIIKRSDTVIWNGLLGQAEKPEYAASSTAIAEYLGTHPEISTVICGGNTAGFTQQLQSTNPSLKFKLVSTGGGASLELLLGHPLPGLDALQDKS